MSDISLVIKRFNALSTTTRVKPIVAALQQVADNTAGDDLIAKLRKKLLPLTTEESSQGSLVDVAYDTLLILAKLYPGNRMEPIMQLDIEEVEPGDRIFISIGHFFSLSLLIEWHDKRPCHRNETNANKLLLNPLTNEAFSARDLAHISTMINKKNMTFPAIIKMLYSSICSLWDQRLFRLGIYLLLGEAVGAAASTFIVPAALGIFNLSVSLFLFSHVIMGMYISNLAVLLLAGLVVMGTKFVQDPEPIIAHLGHEVDRAATLIASPFRWSVRFFSNNNQRSEENQFTEDFLLSPL